jgi:hypothetical protein
MGKRKANLTDNGDVPPIKLQQSSLPNADDPIDYFKEHFCQNLSDGFLRQLKTGNSKMERKVKLESITEKHVAQFDDNGFELVSNFFGQHR